MENYSERARGFWPSLPVFFRMSYNVDITHAKMKVKEVTTKNAAQTGRVAEEFAKNVLGDMGKEPGKAKLICLWGDLGSGKTTFVQAAAAELGVKETVNSPTFLIMKKYPLSGKNRGRTLYHFDLYRIREAREILDLGWEEILSDAKNIVAVEWPGKIEEILPASRIDAEFESVSENERRIIFHFFDEQDNY